MGVPGKTLKKSGRSARAARPLNARCQSGQAIASSLLRWFASAARDLPWRRTVDPYAIWVSEIMLQQTQVKTVLPYWERWMRALPTIAHLAKANPQRLHKLWEGLGYYSRVRNLQKAAQLIIKEHAGRVPDSVEELMLLPGIGRYTAGALCSIAFNRPTPILDGNVIRVLTRVFGINGNPRERTVNARLWHLAEALVELASHETLTPRPCSQFNQALMELGATICTARTPECARCPIAGLCRARAQGRASELPTLPARPKAVKRHFVAFVMESGSRFLIRQRPPGVVNGHLWEFPNAEITGPNPQISLLARVTAGVGSGSRFHHLCRFDHTITRYRITVDVFRTTVTKARPKANGGQWLTLKALQRLPFSSAHKKIVDRLTALLSGSAV